MSDVANETLADVVIDLLGRAAEAWVNGDEFSASRLASGAWRIVGTDDFVDADQ